MENWQKQNPKQLDSCVNCGDEFAKTQPMQKYCSETCQIKANNNIRPILPKATGECLYCNKTFTKDRRDQQYCSNKCKAAAGRARKGVEPVGATRTCKECSKDFQKTSSNQVYCSTECSDEVKRRSKIKQPTTKVMYKPGPLPQNTFTDPWKCAKCTFKQSLCALHASLQKQGKKPPIYRLDLA